jgi:CRP-like cAMP-binding protein
MVSMRPMKLARSEIESCKSLLRSKGWLSGVEPGFREALLSECQWMRVEPAATIARGGETEGALTAVARGDVGIYPVVAAPEAGILHIDRAPFWFGLQPFISGEGRHVTVMARSGCIVASVGQAALERILANHPAGWKMLLIYVGAVFRTTLQATSDLLLPDRDRLCAAVLLRIAGARNAGQDAHPVHCSHEELAAMCNVSRQTIAGVLKRLESRGEVELGYRSIALPRPDSLRRYVDGA